MNLFVSFKVWIVGMRIVFWIVSNHLSATSVLVKHQMTLEHQRFVDLLFITHSDLLGMKYYISTKIYLECYCIFRRNRYPISSHFFETPESLRLKLVLVHPQFSSFGQTPRDVETSWIRCQKIFKQ